MKSHLKKFWSERNERERKVLIFAALFLSASLLYAFLWLPGQKAANRLNAEIPILRSKLAMMRSEALEVDKLKNHMPGFRGGIREEIETSAKAADIKLKSIAGEDHVAAEFSPVPFQTWVAWMEKLGTDEHIKLESVHIEKLDEMGSVQISAVFGRAS